SLFLTDCPATLCPDRLRRRITGGLIEPAREDSVSRQRTGLAREVGKYGLGHVLRQVGVATDQSQRGGIDEVDMPRHQLAESRFGAVFDVAAQLLGVVVHILFTY